MAFYGPTCLTYIRNIKEVATLYSQGCVSTGVFPNNTFCLKISK